MKLDRIKISMEFNVMGNGLWLTGECGIAPDEDPIEEFKKGRDLLVDAFNKMDNRNGLDPAWHIPSMTVRGIEPPDEKTDAEFIELKKKLSKFKTGQEAFDYLSTTPFKHTIEAKQFITTKFSKNAK